MKAYWALNLFPIPRRYLRVPIAIAYAVLAAMVVVLLKEQTIWSVILFALGVLLVAAVYWIRSEQKKEWTAFFEDENAKIMKAKTAAEYLNYVKDQKHSVESLRHPELKTQAKLNLSSLQLAFCEPEEALSTLTGLDPQSFPNESMQLLLYSQMITACCQKKDIEGAESVYASAIDVLEHVSDYLKISFIPTEIQYHLLRGEYELALNQIGEIPMENLSQESRDHLTAMRICALNGVGAVEKAQKLTRQIESHEMYPSSRAFFQ